MGWEDPTIEGDPRHSAVWRAIKASRRGECYRTSICIRCRAEERQGCAGGSSENEMRDKVDGRFVESRRDTSECWRRTKTGLLYRMPR